MRGSCFRMLLLLDTDEYCISRNCPHLTPPNTGETVYADPELQDRAQLEVPLQTSHQFHRWRRPANPIPTALADQPCANLGVEGMLSHLNKLMHTGHDLIRTHGLRRVLTHCIEDGEDFGYAYGRLRQWWPAAEETGSDDDDFAFVKLWKRWKRPTEDKSSRMEADARERESDDKAKREYAMNRERGVIVYPRLPPRRVWDLHSNRVLERWMVTATSVYDFEHNCLYAVSHSWMDAEQRHDVQTPINGYKWPVPIPNDITLERVRIELLNLGAEYAWLDVLCLRQDPRHPEWKLDIPTIGNIYRWSYRIVQYFSGLGRPFRVGDMKSKRHWLNRAWTLQEIGLVNNITAGITLDSPVSPNPILIDRHAYEHVTMTDIDFEETLASMRELAAAFTANIFHAVETMSKRHAEYEQDKIAGLVFLLSPTQVPLYIRGENPEQTWDRLLACVGNRYRAQLFFLYPLPGFGSSKWRPTWQQLSLNELSSSSAMIMAGSKAADYTNLSWGDWQFNGLFQVYSYVLRHCKLRAFNKVLTPGSPEGSRTGTVLVEKDSLLAYSFRIHAVHAEPIPEAPSYALLGHTYHAYQPGTPDIEKVYDFWVLGYFTGSAKFVKVMAITALFGFAQSEEFVSQPSPDQRLRATEEKKKFEKLRLGQARWVELA